MRDIEEGCSGEYVLVADRAQAIAAAVADAAPEGLIEAEDPDGTFHRWLRASGGARGSVVVLRPDRFVFALVRAARMPETTRELARQLHRAEAETVPALQPATTGLMEAA